MQSLAIKNIRECFLANRLSSKTHAMFFDRILFDEKHMQLLLIRWLVIKNSRGRIAGSSEDEQVLGCLIKGLKLEGAAGIRRAAGKILASDKQVQHVAPHRLRVIHDRSEALHPTQR